MFPGVETSWDPLLLFDRGLSEDLLYPSTHPLPGPRGGVSGGWKSLNTSGRVAGLSLFGNGHTRYTYVRASGPSVSTRQGDVPQNLVKL